MSSNAVYDELDQAIESLLTNPEPAARRDDFDGLLAIAAELHHLPRPAFKARLRADLEDAAGLIALPEPRPFTPNRRPGGNGHHREEEILPTLFGAGYDSYPVRRVNFVASMLLHTAAVALIAISGFWMVQHRQEIQQQTVSLISPEISQYIPPPAPDKAGGGGGGGDRDKLAASQGSLPKLRSEQITPPAVVIRNDHPKLPVAPSVVVPPSITFPQTALNLGDPMSNVAGPPSNGIGSGGGIGSGTGGGVGSGTGPGVGPGIGGGIGGGVFKVGGGVSAPRAIYSPDPEYSEEARKAKYQGTSVLWVIIGPDGRPREVKIARSLGMGLDEKAIEAVRTWKFAPALKDGHPVAVQVNIEVSFRLY